MMWRLSNRWLRKLARNNIGKWRNPNSSPRMARCQPDGLEEFGLRVFESPQWSINSIHYRINLSAS